MGQNVVVGEEEDRAIRIRYRRPGGLPPSGEWGTCGPGTEGGLTIRDSRLGTDRSSHFEALFQVILPACDGSVTETQQLNGSFDVTLRRSLADACPE
jgi:hypothetical protein